MCSYDSQPRDKFGFSLKTLKCRPFISLQMQIKFVSNFLFFDIIMEDFGYNIREQFITFLVKK